MTEKNNILHYPNPDLVVLKENRPRWNQPETRRHGFHNFYRLPRSNFQGRNRSK